MRSKELIMCEKAQLIGIIEELQQKLKRKNTELHSARVKLRSAKGKLTKMKDTVAYQRKRILELYQ
jgi:hypothetical protein